MSNESYRVSSGGVLTVAGNGKIRGFSCLRTAQNDTTEQGIPGCFPQGYPRISVPIPGLPNSSSNGFLLERKEVLRP